MMGSSLSMGAVQKETGEYETCSNQATLGFGVFLIITVAKNIFSVK